MESTTNVNLQAKMSQEIRTQNGVRNISYSKNPGESSPQTNVKSHRLVPIRSNVTTIGSSECVHYRAGRWIRGSGWHYADAGTSIDEETNSTTNSTDTIYDEEQATGLWAGSICRHQCLAGAFPCRAQGGWVAAVGIVAELCMEIAQGSSRLVSSSPVLGMGLVLDSDHDCGSDLVA